jgi:hypothetical protein
MGDSRHQRLQDTYHFWGIGQHALKAIPNSIPSQMDSLVEALRVAPAEAVEARNIKNFTIGAVGLGRVKDQLAPEAECSRHSLGELANGHVFANADVDQGRSQGRASGLRRDAATHR